jgi:transposase InsO family protein
LPISYLATDFVLDAPERPIYDRCTHRATGLIHHSDRGTLYLSVRYTDRLVDAAIEPSVGSRGDSYDNAQAESIIGLFKLMLPIVSGKVPGSRSWALIVNAAWYLLLDQHHYPRGSKESP